MRRAGSESASEARKESRFRPPASTDWGREFPAKTLIQNRRIVLKPTPDRDMIQGQPTLRHDFFQVAVDERVPQIPANANQDDHIFEVPPQEQCWSPLPHTITVSERLTFAADPLALAALLAPRMAGLYPR